MCLSTTSYPVFECVRDRIEIRSKSTCTLCYHRGVDNFGGVEGHPSWLTSSAKNSSQTNSKA
jgi:hypothetical protein